MTRRDMPSPPRIVTRMRSGRVVRGVWAACLIVAGLNHAGILLRYGLFWDYGGVGGASAFYWSSLTIVDPLVAALLIVRPRIGRTCTLLVIATNVLHNLLVTARYVPRGTFLQYVATTPVLLSQIAFLMFVIATWRMAGTDLPPTRHR